MEKIEVVVFQKLGVFEAFLKWSLFHCHTCVHHLNSQCHYVIVITLVCNMDAVTLYVDELLDAFM